jgi:hypothetical protein
MALNKILYFQLLLKIYFLNAMLIICLNAEILVIKVKLTNYFIFYSNFLK